MSNFYAQIIVPCAGVLPVIIGLLRKKYWNKQARILLIYLGIAGLFNIIASLTFRSNNMPYLHLYTVLEFTILCIYLRSFSERHRLLFNSLIVGFLLLSLWLAFVKKQLFVFNEIPRFLDSLIISIGCLYFLLKDLGSTFSNLSRFQFLTLTGLLFYYSTCSVLFGLSSELTKMPREIATLMWNIHHTLLLLMYILFALAFYSLKNKENGR